MNSLVLEDQELKYRVSTKIIVSAIPFWMNSAQVYLSLSYISMINPINPANWFLFKTCITIYKLHTTAASRIFHILSTKNHTILFVQAIFNTRL